MTYKIKISTYLIKVLLNNLLLPSFLPYPERTPRHINCLSEIAESLMGYGGYGWT